MRNPIGKTFFEKVDKNNKEIISLLSHWIVIDNNHYLMFCFQKSNYTIELVTFSKHGCHMPEERITDYIPIWTSNYYVLSH